MSIKTKSPVTLAERLRSVREFTRTICGPLEVEDYVIQSMPDVSPTRWHLAHTTWFFETFVLKPYHSGYRPQQQAFEFLFNSYYNTVGEQFPRDRRGLLARPTVKDVWEYRQAIDDSLVEFLGSSRADDPEIQCVVELGIQHEQQHQELMVTDLKHVFSCNPLFPTYHSCPSDRSLPDEKQKTLQLKPQCGGRAEIGFAADGFCFDNELPQFEFLLTDYQLADRLITNGEYLEFIEAGGYSRPEHWLSMGWSTVQREDWKAPLYWVEQAGEWHEFALGGLRPIDLNIPVCHVSYFEADAFARWSGARLPTEFEWEHAASQIPIQGNFSDSTLFHPRAASAASVDDSSSLMQMFGDAWEWTSSQYTAYPGYQPPEGALGEYNGKFMCNQFVLRGGSCATPRSHIRATYRNFFPPDARWQFTGIRVAK